MIPECLKWELLAFRWRQHNTKMSVQDIFPLLKAKNILENGKWKRLLKVLAAPEIFFSLFCCWRNSWYLVDHIRPLIFAKLLIDFFLFCKPPLRLLTYLFWKEKCLLNRQNIKIFENDNFNKIKYEQSLRRVHIQELAASWIYVWSRWEVCAAVCACLLLRGRSWPLYTAST